MRSYNRPTKRYERPYHLYEGAKIKFYREKQRYTVKCTSKRFTICTKPLNVHKTVLYTIIDWEEQRRGPEDLIFGMGAETKEQCLEMLVRLIDGESIVSLRHDCPLDIEKIVHGDEVVYDDKLREENKSGMITGKKQAKYV